MRFYSIRRFKKKFYKIFDKLFYRDVRSVIYEYIHFPVVDCLPIINMLKIPVTDTHNIFWDTYSPSEILCDFKKEIYDNYASYDELLLLSPTGADIVSNDSIIVLFEGIPKHRMLLEGKVSIEKLCNEIYDQRGAILKAYNLYRDDLDLISGRLSFRFYGYSNLFIPIIEASFSPSTCIYQ